jgi:hypothetical protein
MRLTHLNFIHFFIEDREYSLEALNTVHVSITNDHIDIAVRVLNDASTESLTSFFIDHKDDSILFLIGYNSKEEDPIVSVTGKFSTYSISKGICTMRFLRDDGEF